MLINRIKIRRWLVPAMAVCLAIFAGVSLAGYSLGLAHAESFAAAHHSARSSAILSQARQRDWPVVVLGDSMTELAMLETLCGKPVLNAGIAGARIGDLTEFGKGLLDEVQPQLVIIAAGTNDAWAHKPTDAAAFETDYRALVHSAQSSGAQVVALTAIPVGPAGMGKADVFDRDELRQRNSQIAALEIPVVDAAAALDDGKGRLLMHLTDDGVHPNAAGYERWLSALEGACETAT